MPSKRLWPKLRLAWKRRRLRRSMETASRIMSSCPASRSSSSISTRSRSAIPFETWHPFSPIWRAGPGCVRCRRTGRVQPRQPSSKNTSATHRVGGVNASHCSARAPSLRWRQASSGLKSRVGGDDPLDHPSGATQLPGGPGMTGSDEGPEDQERRSPRRGMNAGEENEPAAERSYSELLDQIRATDERYSELPDQLRSLTEPRPFAVGRGAPPPAPTTP